MTTAALLIFALALLVNAGSPGPSVAALVARVISAGPGSVLPFLLAMWIGEVGWLIAAILGLGLMAQKLLFVLTIIKFAGVAYLLYLAWKMWNAPVKPEGADLPTARSPWKLFATGLSLTIGNPKIALFYMALLPSLINLQTLSAFDAVKIAMTCLCVMAFTDLSWVAAASWARRLLKSPRAVRIANRSSACAMGCAAVAIAAK
jgi:threonine/homoserine/homoserine lactone efflux protein